MDFVDRIMHSSYTGGIFLSMISGLLWFGYCSTLAKLIYGSLIYSMPYAVVSLIIFPLFIGWKTREIIKSSVFTYIFYVFSQGYFFFPQFSATDIFLILLVIFPLMALLLGGLAGGAFGDYEIRSFYPFLTKKSKYDTISSREELNMEERVQTDFLSPRHAPRVFLSHSNKDKAFVEYLAKKLESDGFSVWYDDWEIYVGDSIVQKINDGISTSDFLVVVLSRNSVNSKWVQEELNAATIKNMNSKGAFILPVLLEGCRIPPLLADRRYANFSKNPKSAYQELVEAINYHLKNRGSDLTQKSESGNTQPRFIKKSKIPRD